MWRLRHGEGLASEGPQLAVIMIGSSDLTYASLKVPGTCLTGRHPQPPTPQLVFFLLGSVLLKLLACKYSEHAAFGCSWALKALASPIHSCMSKVLHVMATFSEHTHCP